MGADQASQHKNEDALSQAFFRDQDVAACVEGSGDSRGKILRKLLKYLLPILLSLLLIDHGIAWLFPPEKLVPFTQYEVLFYTLKADRLEKAKDLDVLVLGSSRIEGGFDPSLFSQALSLHLKRPIKSYNMGMVNGKMEEYLTIATSHLPDPPPRYVLIGFSGNEVIRAHMFQYASRFLWHLPNFLSYLKRTPFNKFKVRNVEFFIECSLSRAWYLFKHRNALSSSLWLHTKKMLGVESKWDLAHYQMNEKRKNAQFLVDDGYGLDELDTKVENLAEQIKNTPDFQGKIPRRLLTMQPEVFDESSAELLGLVVKVLREKGCKVIFVEAPPSPFLQRKCPVVNGEVFRSWATKMSEALDVPLILCRPQDTKLHNSLYRDTNHLNIHGAERYTRYLLRELVKIDFFSEESS